MIAAQELFELFFARATVHATYRTVEALNFLATFTASSRADAPWFLRIHAFIIAFTSVNCMALNERTFALRQKCFAN